MKIFKSVLLIILAAELFCCFYTACSIDRCRKRISDSYDKLRAAEHFIYQYHYNMLNEKASQIHHETFF